jgi:hypothetical protein
VHFLKTRHHDILGVPPPNKLPPTIHWAITTFGMAGEGTQGHQPTAPAGPHLGSMLSTARAKNQKSPQKQAPWWLILGLKHSSTQPVPATNSHVYVMPTAFHIQPQASAPRGTMILSGGDPKDERPWKRGLVSEGAPPFDPGPNQPSRAVRLSLLSFWHLYPPGQQGAKTNSYSASSLRTWYTSEADPEAKGGHNLSRG